MKTSVYSKFTHVVLGGVLVITATTVNAAQPALATNKDDTVTEAQKIIMTAESAKQLQQSIEMQLKSLNLQLTDKVNKNFTLSSLPVVVKQPQMARKLNNSASE